MGFLNKYISKENRTVEDTPVEDAVQLDDSRYRSGGEPLDQIPGDEDNKPVRDPNEETLERDGRSEDTGDNASTDLEGDEPEGGDDASDDETESSEDGEGEKSTDEGEDETGDMSDEEKKDTDEALESLRQLILKDARAGGLSMESVSAVDIILSDTLAKFGLENIKLVPSVSKFLTPSLRQTSTNVILQGIENLQRKLRK